ncbi:MAG: chorismate mutase [Anaerolineae bacterium]
MGCRGVRGAITVEENTATAILDATRALLVAMVAENGFAVEELGSVIFTATSDLDAAYPAAAARQMGWTQTPLLCMQEMAVKGSLQRCIRVLLHWNTDCSPAQVKHVYLGGAKTLRPDLVEGTS